MLMLPNRIVLNIASGEVLVIKKLKHAASLVPRPLPDFISQPWRNKIWEWPGDKASMQPLCDFPNWSGLQMGGAKHMIKKQQHT